MTLQNNSCNTNCLIDTCNNGTSQLTRGYPTALAKLMPSSSSSVTFCLQQNNGCFASPALKLQLIKAWIWLEICCMPGLEARH